MSENDPITVDDIVHGKAAAQLGEGVIPTRAVLIIETVEENGVGLRYVLTDGVKTWHALGMLRSVSGRLEAEDLDGWAGRSDDL